MTPRLRTAAGGALVAALLFAGLAWANPAGAQRLVNERLVEEIRPSDLLGGGDKVFVRFGEDAAFGVLWGNATNPNHIYLVAIKARYLGLADVKTAAGQVVDEDRPIKVYTLYGFKLESLIEFNDTNGDGIASCTRAYDAENYTSYIATEPLH